MDEQFGEHRDVFLHSSEMEKLVMLCGGGAIAAGSVVSMCMNMASDGKRPQAQALMLEPDEKGAHIPDDRSGF